MRNAVAAVCVACCLLAAGSARADADGLTDSLGPREVALGDAMRGGATGGSAAMLNPAGLPLTNELVFEGGYGYRPSDSASVVSVSACDSTNAAPGCFYYGYVSASPELGGMTGTRTAHVVGATVSRRLTPRVFLGAGLKYFRFSSDMAGEDDAKGLNWDLGMTMRLSEEINLGVVGYNLAGAESTNFPRAVGGGVQVRPVANLTANFDALWNLDLDEGAGRFGGGLEYFLAARQGQMGYPIRLGGLHDRAGDATYISAGLGMTTMKMAVDIGGRRQVGGGDEMMVVASLRFFGPRQAAPAIQ